MNNQIRVLIAEDNIDDAELLVLELESANYHVIYQIVDSVATMSNALKNEVWDIILTDYSMPHFSAIAALNLVQELELDTPFIVVSGSIGEETAVELMRFGAHDYLLKQNLTRLIPAVKRELREAKMRSERQQALKQIRTLAFVDELTGLPNRNALLKVLQMHIHNSHHDAHKFAVLFLDVDQYRNIKYGFGHIKSEQLLIEIAKRLKSILSPDDYLAKVGKDEFVLLFGNIINADNLEIKANKIHLLLDPPFQMEGFLTYASITIGIVESRMDFADANEFLRAAEIANYNAKQKALNSYSTVIYSKNMQTQILERLNVENQLRQAISNQELRLFYQPIVCLKSHKLVGFEALIRWQHPQKGWISPADFIPIAEQTGLIIPLGEWILETACKQMKVWETQLIAHLPLSLSVNVSGVQLNEPELVPLIIYLHQFLNQQKVNLKLEITETRLMNNTHSIIASLRELRNAGIKISIDDFGTGYSSLSYLQNLPIDTLKIDRSFVCKIADNPQGLGIIQAIITLAHTLGLDIVAEGVETLTQMDYLQSLGCDYGQGYLFSPAITADLVQDWLVSYLEKIYSINNPVPQGGIKN
ncbi:MULTISPECIES: bifunctional diguanylate cyclase/phosphodiesterase [unclassified Anabaena]|uniref:putative bifunctional diguanylate cyclase/phosphodiesterase n=1 Tax=unclassified Anabaena TaxID=2619674 RepID=UPI0014477C32|nr:MULTISPECIES: EAL domain-containing protein [unclassified Anabaena]MTJ10036.1 EAL domain-containing protein [Anabaena sp. UHCC 0204]MTJ53541.1 EAL domain-containing protein [Anabaena sp. UHCC 0253]